MDQLLKGFCVICNERKHLKIIKGCDGTRNNNSGYSDMIYKCFFIQFLDKHFGRNNKICKKCIKDLKFCCNFRLKVELAHQKLYHIVQCEREKQSRLQSMKIESIVKFKSEHEDVDDTCDDKYKFNETYFIETPKDAGVVVKKESVDRRTVHTVNVDSNNSGDNDDAQYNCESNDSDWSTNTDDVLISTGYWDEIEKIENKEPYKPPKLSKACNECPLCEECINDNAKLQEHYKKHISSTLLCDICGQLYNKKYGFEGHMSKHNNINFPCKVCGKVYISRSGRLFHMKQVHLKINMYRCRKCKMSFPDWSLKHKHLIDVHGCHEEYSCEQCGKTFKRRTKLNCHVRRFHLKERNIFCEFCSARFFSKMELKKHIVKHTGVKDHHCQYCGKAFGHRQYLAEHLKIHLNIKRFKCDLCGKAFVQKCSLLGHIRTHHKT